MKHPAFWSYLWNTWIFLAYPAQSSFALLLVSIFLVGQIYIYNHKVFVPEMKRQQCLFIFILYKHKASSALHERTNDWSTHTFITFGILANLPFLVSLMTETSNSSVSCNHRWDLWVLWEQQVYTCVHSTTLKDNKVIKQNKYIIMTNDEKQVASWRCES